MVRMHSYYHVVRSSTICIATITLLVKHSLVTYVG